MVQAVPLERPPPPQHLFLMGASIHTWGLGAVICALCQSLSAFIIIIIVIILLRQVLSEPGAC